MPGASVGMTWYSVMRGAYCVVGIAGDSFAGAFLDSRLRGNDNEKYEG